MKIYHAADIHLGRTRLDGLLPDGDLAAAFLHIAQAAVDGGADVFVLAGDLFDRPQVEPGHLRQAQEGLRILKDAGIPVVAAAAPIMWLGPKKAAAEGIARLEPIHLAACIQPQVVLAVAVAMASTSLVRAAPALEISSTVCFKQAVLLLAGLEIVALGVAVVLAREEWAQAASRATVASA